MLNLMCRGQTCSRSGCMWISSSLSSQILYPFTRWMWAGTALARRKSCSAKDVGTMTSNTAVPTPVCNHHSNQLIPLSASESTALTQYMGLRILDETNGKDELIPHFSEEGKSMLIECLNSGSFENYIALTEQFVTQASPPSCGTATLTMVLNSLKIDPGRVWQRPWRWFTEETLISCFPLEKSEQTLGLTMEHFALIAECNGSTAQTFYGSHTSQDDFRSVVRNVFVTKPPPGDGNSKRLVVAFDRKVLAQTGTGHYSPIGAYNEKNDMLLVLDVARFKYAPYWVPLTTMWEALRTVDPETRRSRGFFVLTRAATADSAGLEIVTRYDNLYNAVTDVRNSRLKQLAAELVHDVRKQLLTCSCIADTCNTLIDCSNYKGGKRLLEQLKLIDEFQHEIQTVHINRSTNFTKQSDMRPLDVFIQSMPQYFNELLVILVIKHGSEFLVQSSIELDLK